MNAAGSSQQWSSASFEVAKIKVFPNPSNGIFKIDTALPTEIKVVDITGKEVYSASNITNQSSINVSNLQQGVYLLKMKNELGEQTEKIIIK